MRGPVGETTTPAERDPRAWRDELAVHTPSFMIHGITTLWLGWTAAPTLPMTDLLAELGKRGAAPADVARLRHYAQAHQQHQYLHGELEDLGYHKLDQRRRIVEALLATADDAQPTTNTAATAATVCAQESCLSQADSAFSASEPSVDDKQQTDALPYWKPSSSWWIVSGERVAVRESPSRQARALDVMRTSAVLQISGVEVHGDPIAVDGLSHWAKLTETELQFLCSMSTEAAYMLIQDDELGELLARLPERADLEADGVALDSSSPLFDERLHPAKRAAEARARWAGCLAETARPPPPPTSLATGAPEAAALEPTVTGAPPTPAVEAAVSQIATRTLRQPFAGPVPELACTEAPEPGDVPLGDVSLCDVPLSDVPLGDVPLGDVPLGDVPLGNVQQSDTPPQADAATQATIVYGDTAGPARPAWLRNEL